MRPSNPLLGLLYTRPTTQASYMPLFLCWDEIVVLKILCNQFSLWRLTMLSIQGSSHYA